MVRKPQKHVETSPIEFGRLDPEKLPLVSACLAEIGAEAGEALPL